MFSHGENKYLKAQVVAMLVVCFVLIGSLTFGAVSVPSPNFQQGTTISSSAVNANFNYLGSAMPAFKIVNPGSATITGTGLPYQVLGTYQYTAPANGYVKIRVSCTYASLYRSNTSVSNYIYFGMSTSSSSFWNYAMSEVYANDSGTYKYFNPSSEWYGNVYKGNTYTYYMLAFRDSSGYNSWYIYIPLMTIEFFPSQL